MIILKQVQQNRTDRGFIKNGFKKNAEKPPKSTTLKTSIYCSVSSKQLKCSVTRDCQKPGWVMSPRHVCLNNWGCSSAWDQLGHPTTRETHPTDSSIHHSLDIVPYQCCYKTNGLQEITKSNWTTGQTKTIFTSSFPYQ